MRSNKKSKKPLLLLLILLGLIVVTFLLNPFSFIKSLLIPVSVFSQVTGQKLQARDGRTNILVLGLDQREGENSGRTDTILLGSVGLTTGDAALISVPRDLWIPTLAVKINAAYVYGGVASVRGTLEKILGLPIHYFAVIDFSTFEKAVDIVGGITVNVENSFADAFYPIYGREDDTCGLDAFPEATESSEFSFPCRFEKIQFAKSEQKMDGKTALKFVRSRHAGGDEGTDYARSARQQKVIEALGNKILSWEVLANPGKAESLFSTFKTGLTTNIGFFEAEKFYALGKKVNLSLIRTVVLDEDNVLYNPPLGEAYGGAWVLVPRSGDFSGVAEFVEKFVFGEPASPSPSPK